jgi:hypothetical protein
MAIKLDRSANIRWCSIGLLFRRRRTVWRVLPSNNFRDEIFYRSLIRICPQKDTALLLLRAQKTRNGSLMLTKFAYQMMDGEDVCSMILSERMMDCTEECEHPPPRHAGIIFTQEPLIVRYKLCYPWSLSFRNNPIIRHQPSSTFHMSCFIARKLSNSGNSHVGQISDI